MRSTVTGSSPITAPPPGPTPPPPDPGAVDKRVVEITISGRTIWYVLAAIVATMVMLWAADQASTLMALIAMSFFFSLALDPAVRRLVDRFEWRRGTAVAVIYLAGLLFVGFLIAVLVPAIAQLAETIRDQGSGWINNVNEWTESTFGFSITDQSQASELAQEAGASIEEWATGLFGTLLDVAATGIGLIFNLATIALFTFYLTASAPQVQQAVLKLFSPAIQERIGWTWDQAIVQTGGYFYSRMLLMLINGSGFFFTMVLVGIPVGLALAMAVFAGFVSEFIPAIGTYIGGAIPILLSLALEGLTAGIIVLAYVLIYQQLENYWLSPRISANTMTLNGGVAFGAALAGGAIGGPMGAFVALPVAALISSFVANYVTSYEVVYHSDRDEGEGHVEHGHRSSKMMAGLRRRLVDPDDGPDATDDREPLDG